MVKKRESAAATKTDLHALDTALGGRIDGVDRTIARVAAEVVRTQADVREIKETMATKSDINRILSAIDTFAFKTESHDRASVIHGQTLVEVEVTLKDHERRLSSLESPRPPNRP